jgi:hypothetical protein
MVAVQKRNKEGKAGYSDPRISTLRDSSEFTLILAFASNDFNSGFPMYLWGESYSIG